MIKIRRCSVVCSMHTPLFWNVSILFHFSKSLDRTSAATPPFRPSAFAFSIVVSPGILTWESFFRRRWWKTAVDKLIEKFARLLSSKNQRRGCHHRRPQHWNLNLNVNLNCEFEFWISSESCSILRFCPEWEFWSKYQFITPILYPFGPVDGKKPEVEIHAAEKVSNRLEAMRLNWGIEEVDLRNWLLLASILRCFTIFTSIFQMLMTCGHGWVQTVC